MVRIPPAYRWLLTLCAISSACLGQTAAAPAITGTGYASPFPLIVAPGQLITIYVQTPASLAGEAGPNVSAMFRNQQTVESVPVLQAVPWSGDGCLTPPPNSICASGLAITVQIPFDVPDSVIVSRPLSIALTVNEESTGYVGMQAQPDHVHIFNSCETIIGGESCAPLVMHSNGQPVSYQNPAAGGEELVAYVTGLGQTNPPLTTGTAAAQSSPAVSGFNLDFNYRQNALATQPGTVPNLPLFAGSTQGFIGLYQINFVVPAPPAGLAPCSNLDFIADGPVGGLVLSNLTVSVGSVYSFDGAGICVTPAS